MVNLSTTGCYATITGAGLKVTLTQWSDEAAIEIDSLTVHKTAMNLNGELVNWSNPNPVRVHLTVLPNSDDYYKMRNFLTAISVPNSHTYINTQYKTITSLQISYKTSKGKKTGDIKNIIFKNGILESGMPGIGSNADGKAQTGEFVFVFESYAGA